MPNAQIESDPLFQLLTDALRAGPQSPEWAQAVSRVRESGSTEADEYKALLAARENLEGGREYKSVRAGAGFTRELFGKIDEEKAAAKAKGLPTATLLAMAAGIVILGVIVAVGVMASRSAGKNDAGETLPAVFTTSWVNSTFAPGDKGVIVTGANPSGGLKPGGEAFVERPIDGRFEIEADVQAAAGNADAPLVQILIPGGGQDAKAGMPGALSWQLLGSTQRVSVGEQSKQTAPVPADGKVTVRLVVGKTKAAVYANKELLWAGEHGLAAGPKSPGVRIMPAKDAGGSTPTVTALRVRAESKTATE